MKTVINAPRKILQQKILVYASAADIFPLLCPVREYEWIPGWECDMIFSQSGLAEDNCIFATQPDDGGGKDVWVISRYEPPHTLQFVRVNALRVIRYNISTISVDAGVSEMLWEQVVTSLSEEGNQWIKSYTQENFSRLIIRIGELLNHWFQEEGAN
ncbi:MAG: hypothetical protein U0T82_00130 [Bacteroidales bacterium]